MSLSRFRRLWHSNGRPRTRAFMHPISEVQLAEAARIIGATGADNSAIEEGVRALVGEAMSARRVIDWLPEAFALVFIPHVASVHLPTTFRARNRKGKWETFGMDAEPILGNAILLGSRMYHHGPRETFSNIVSRSSLLAVVNRALNEGADITGATLSRLALIGVPAEVYLPSGKPFWKKLFR